MKIKIVQKAWYNERLYDPDIEDEVVIDFPANKVEDLPSWAEPVEKGVKAKQKQEDNGQGEGEDAKKVTKQKVSELPLAEKNLLLQEAAKYNITGNQVLSWGVDTLKKKIEDAKQKQDESGQGEE